MTQNDSETSQTSAAQSNGASIQTSDSSIQDSDVSLLIAQSADAPKPKLASVAKQHSDEIPPVSPTPSYYRQSSDPEGTRLRRIRQTLHGDRRTRLHKDNPVQRHSSFHTSRSPDQSHDYTRSLSVMVKQSASDHSELTETLPPSKLQINHWII